MPSILLHYLPTLKTDFRRFVQFNRQSSKIPKIQKNPDNLELTFGHTSQIFMEYVLLLLLTQGETNLLFMSNNCYSSGEGIFFYYYFGKAVKPGFRIINISQWYNEIRDLSKWLLVVNVHEQQQIYKQKQKKEWIAWLTNLVNKPEHCVKISNKQSQIQKTSILGVELKEGLNRIIEKIQTLGVFKYNNISIRTYNSMIARKMIEECLHFGYYQKNIIQYRNKLTKGLIVRDHQTLFNKKLEELFLFLNDLFTKRIIGIVHKQLKQVHIQQFFGRQETLTIHNFSFLTSLYQQSMHDTIPEEMTSYDIIKFSRGCMKAQFQGQFYKSKGKISLKTKTYWKIDMRDFVNVQRIWENVQHQWPRYITQCYSFGLSIDPYKIQLKWSNQDNVYLHQNLHVIKDEFTLDIFIEALNRHMLFWLIFQNIMENAFRKTSKINILEDINPFNKKKIIQTFKKCIKLLYSFIQKFRQ